ncbi:MFS transporter, partial [Micromonospora phytophila]|nr:MFS transporter [Micromonospora phytophila]
MSTYGSFLNLVVLGLFTLEVTGSAMQTGMVMAVRLTAGLVMGPLAGVLAGRHPRKHLMIGSDLVSAGTLVALVAAPAGARPTLLWALAVVLGCGQTLWSVSLRSGLPDTVAARDLSRANSHLVAARSVAMLLGLASAGVLAATFGYHAAFLFDAASYALSALLLAALPARRPGRGPARDGATGHGPRLPGRLSGIAPIIVAMIAVRAVDAFGSASHNVGLPVQANLVRPDSPESFTALFLTSWAVGSLVAGRWYARRAARAPQRGAALRFGAA